MAQEEHFEEKLRNNPSMDFQGLLGDDSATSFKDYTSSFYNPTPEPFISPNAIPGLVETDVQTWQPQQAKVDEDFEVDDLTVEGAVMDSSILQKSATILKGGERLTVHNVLASCSLGHKIKLDLEKIVGNLGNAFLNTAEFPAARMDIKGKSGAIYTISLFDTGKMQKIAKKLKHTRALYPELSFKRFEVQNILAVLDVGHSVSLGMLCSIYPGDVDFEPDRFQAARFRVPMEEKVKVSKGLKQPKREVVTVNCFSTGKVTFTGGKSIESIVKSWDAIRDYVRESNM
ncbi:MAG: uncharacterized protein KVP18_001379 [Porospora cf. gigantea A]|uniref:uncharacterized protein n=1 Tax=Porospora cf. gigantea A TaxID=2853593 RepID=UPI00355AAD42|nr:MAG: hypothetical protein KVP18_001379 [Porospora cf. gigantea A]